MNEQSEVRHGELQVDAEALCDALVASGAGRARSEVIGVRVGLQRGGVVRAHAGLVVREAFPCEASGRGVFLAPARALVDALHGVKGNLQIAFASAGDSGHVRVQHGDTRLFQHKVRDSRLTSIGGADRIATSGTPVAAGPVAFALRQARDFLSPDATRRPEHRVLYVGPLPGADQLAVLGRDDHGLVICLLKGPALATITIPVEHTTAVISFLSRRDSVTVSKSGARFGIADDVGSALGWHCAVDPWVTSPPPALPTVSVEREALLAAIDRLPSRPDTVAVLTLAGPEGQLTIRERSSEALEVVNVGVVSDPPVTATVRLARLRRACDTASSRMQLHLSSRCVMTRDQLCVNRAGRRVQREGVGTVHVETYRVVAPMENKNHRTAALRDQAATETLSRGSTP